MFRMQHQADYFKEEFNLEDGYPLEKEQYIEKMARKNLKQTLNSKRFKRSDDSLNLPEGFRKGEAIGGGDCFFDAVAQGLKRLKPEMDFTVKSLREVCKTFAQSQVENDQSWLKEAL